MSEMLFYAFCLALICFLLYIIYIAVYSVVRGGPYAAIGQKRLKDVMLLADIKKGQKFADLGSGDGRIVIEAAKLGANAYGYEINPLLVLASRKRIKELKLKNAHILSKDLWSENYSKYSTVTVYVLPHILGALGKKLKREMRPGSKVISNYYKIPGWKIDKTRGSAHLYRI